MSRTVRRAQIGTPLQRFSSACDLAYNRCMIPYPKELRARIVAAVEQGEFTIAEIASLFGVGITFIKKMLKLHRAGDDLEPRHGGGPEVLLKEKELALLRKEINKHPDATLVELQKVLAKKRNVTASLPTICRALQQLNLPRKKKGLIANERDEKERRKFRRIIIQFVIGKLVFIDEMGSNIAMTRLYGRAKPGKRIFEKIPGNRGKNVSTIGAISLDGIRTGLSVQGAIDGETMVFFVEELLAPRLKRGDIVILDNCSIHKMEEIEEIIEARGAWVIFLPRYSPDLNPIENCWSKVKAVLRSLKPRTLEELLDALVEAFSSVTLKDILGWFNHCGYQAART